MFGLPPPPLPEIFTTGLYPPCCVTAGLSTYLEFWAGPQLLEVIEYNTGVEATAHGLAI